MLKLVEQRPQEKAPSAFPAAARAKRSIFFSGASKTRKDATVLEVQTRINSMIEKCVGRYAALVDRNLPPLSLALGRTLMRRKSQRRWALSLAPGLVLVLLTANAAKADEPADRLLWIGTSAIPARDAWERGLQLN